MSSGRFTGNDGTGAVFGMCQYKKDEDLAVCLAFSPDFFPNNSDHLGELYMPSVLKRRIDMMPLPCWVQVEYVEGKGGRKYFAFKHLELSEPEREQLAWAQITLKEGAVLDTEYVHFMLYIVCVLCVMYWVLICH